MGSSQFFDRARARLRLKIPPGLSDASIIPISGDPGNDRMLQIIAQERPNPPCGGADSDRGPRRADRAADAARRASQRSCRPNLVSRRQDRCDRRLAARCRAARGRGRNRPQARIHRSDRLSRSVCDGFWVSHPAHAGPHQARLQIAHQQRPKWTTPSKCRWRS